MTTLLRRANLAGCVISAVFLLIAIVRIATKPAVRGMEDGGDGWLWFCLAAGALLYFALNYLVRPWSRPIARAWVSSLMAGVISLLCLIATWNIAHDSHHRTDSQGTPIHNQGEVDSYLAQHTPAGSGQILIPTGINVLTVEFLNSHDVRVTGYLWQRYAPGVPATIQQGVIFPEAREQQALTEAYQVTGADGAKTIGWFFSAVVRQQFDYSRYPLDRQDVWIRMWHKDFDRKVLLVPDLAAYPPWDDHGTYGLDQQYANVSFTPHYTVFSYRLNGYDSSFGYGRYQPKTPQPELYFNIGLDRKFRGVLGEILAPLALVSLLIFAAIFVTTADHEKRQRVGFTTLATLTLTMSGGFVVVTRHQGVIGSTDVGKMVYIEIFAYAMYIAIAFAAMNAVLYATTNIRVLHWRENLLPALLYWPVLLGSLLVASVIILY